MFYNISQPNPSILEIELIKDVAKTIVKKQRINNVWSFQDLKTIIYQKRYNKFDSQFTKQKTIINDTLMNKRVICNINYKYNLADNQDLYLQNYSSSQSTIFLENLESMKIIQKKHRPFLSILSLQQINQTPKNSKKSKQRLEEFFDHKFEISNQILDIYSPSPYRFVIGFLFILADMTNTLQSSTFSIIAPRLATIYDLQPITVNLVSLSYLFILTPIANYVIDAKGMGFSVRLGVFLGIAGAWMKYWVNNFFEIVIIGTALTAIGGPFIFNSKAIVAANWFKPASWPQVTIIITFATMLNAIVSILIPGFWFSNYDIEIDQNDVYQTGKDLVKSLMMSYAISIGVLVIVLFHNKPDMPASFSSTVKRENFKEASKGLMRSKNYLLFLVGASLAFGSYTGGIVVTVAFLVKPFGYNESDTSTLILAIPVAAIIGTAIAQQLFKRSKQYKKFIMFNFFMQAVLTLCILFIMELGNFYITLLGMGLLGLFAIPVVPIAYEYACEIVFPIGEGSALGYLIGFSSIMAFLFGIVFSYIIQGESKMQSYYGVFTLIGIFLLSLVLIGLTDEDLRRTKADKIKCEQQSQVKFQLNFLSFQKFLILSQNFTYQGHYRTFIQYGLEYKNSNLIQKKQEQKRLQSESIQQNKKILKKIEQINKQSKKQYKTCRKDNGTQSQAQINTTKAELTENFIDIPDELANISYRSQKSSRNTLQIDNSKL